MSAVVTSAHVDAAPVQPPSDASILRRGFSVIWTAMRTHPGPFALSIGGSTMYALMAVGGSVALGM